MVHNGIIENYKELKEYLQKKGFVFLSETDTEVVAHLLDYYYKGNPLEAIARALGRIRGSYALGILFKDQPGKIYAVRKDSPLIIGRSENGNFIASDVPEIYEKRLLHFRYGDRRVNQRYHHFLRRGPGGPGKRVQDRGVGCEIRRKRRF